MIWGLRLYWAACAKKLLDSFIASVLLDSIFSYFSSYESVSINLMRNPQIMSITQKITSQGNVYSCVYCGANFPTYDDAQTHEQLCSKNPNAAVAVIVPTGEKNWKSERVTIETHKRHSQKLKIIKDNVWFRTHNIGAYSPFRSVHK